MKHSDGFPDKIHLFTNPERIREVITKARHFLGSLCNQVQYAPDMQSNHRLPFNHSVAAEATYDDGATSPSTFDTFEGR